MLVPKRFYSPLFCIVFCSMIFSMVRAPPMDSLAGHGDPQKDPFDLLMEEMDVGSSGNYGHALDDPLLKDTGQLSDLVASSSHQMRNTMTKEQLGLLAKEFQDFKAPGSKLQSASINSISYKVHDLGDMGQYFLKTFFKEQKALFSINRNGFQDIVPLFFSGDQFYFFAKMDNQPFLVFSKRTRAHVPELYGMVKPDVTCETIRSWRTSE